jgi:hypothetical protein
VALPFWLLWFFFQLRQINKQVKQAEKNQQSAIRQGRAGRSIDIVLTGTEPSTGDTPASLNQPIAQHSHLGR